MNGDDAKEASRREARAVALMVEMCNALAGYAHAIDTLLDPGTAAMSGLPTRARLYAGAKRHREGLDADVEHEKLLRARIDIVLNGTVKT